MPGAKMARRDQDEPRFVGTVDEFRESARAWLQEHAEARPRRRIDHDDAAWGLGSDSVAIFPNISAAEERDYLEANRRWHQLKFSAGFAGISWPRQFGGQGLGKPFERAFNREEARFVVPPGGELLSVPLELVAPTILVHGTYEQQARHLPALIRAESIWCQLFSEPGAGSDLASISMRAVRDGDEWVLQGQKVWTSGAHFSDWGYAICRTDPSVPKHKGLTAFMLPMDATGVTVRPLRQMTGGASFNEVFFDDVRISDHDRLGDVGDGWRVALTTLGFERSASNGADGSGQPLGGTYRHVLALARNVGADTDPIVRQRLARVFTASRLMKYNRDRATQNMRAGRVPGAEGSIGKLLWTESMRDIGLLAADLLGASITADTGAWGTYAWNQHILGSPGYRIAGGSDEVQRNIIGERVLGLPPEPRVDRELPFEQTVGSTRRQGA